uniref:Serine-rich p40 protein n=1 Tax=Blackberry calico virus TaxID=3069585 RepID=A0AA50DH82_9VIRU|nr:serine-rich p40 protein [Blackberry calico virus]
MTGVSFDSFKAHWEVLRNGILTLHRDVAAPTLNALNQLLPRMLSRFNDVERKLDVLAAQQANLTTMPAALTELREVVIAGPDTTPTQQSLIMEPNAHRFFSDSTAVFEETSRITRVLPAHPLPLQPSSLPVDELFGQLHALHQNLLQWSIDIDNRVQQLATNLDLKLSFESFQSADRRLHNTIERLISEIHQSVATQQPTTDALSTLQQALEEIKSQLASTSAGDALQQIAQLLTNFRNPEHQSNVNADHEALPALNPTHDSLRCRSYGHISLSGHTFKAAIDFTQRPASSTLLLEITIDRLPNCTRVTCLLSDLGRLVVQKQFDTAHKLTNLPDDVLFLLHLHCPRFTYRREGVC